MPRGGERPARIVWLNSILGAVTVAGCALHESHGRSPRGTL
ncbi:hypothetical protein [Acidomonas methanolica]|nr:hypothetical protein [Acidomonas methanolica]